MLRSFALAFSCIALAVANAPAQQPRWAAAIDSMMQRELARTRTPGAQIAVVKGDRVVYTRGYGVADVEAQRPVTERTLFHTGSLAKLYTGMLLAQMASNGTLDLQAPASRYLPEIAGRQVGNTTAHELLTHSAGWINSGTPWGPLNENALDVAHRNLGDTMMVTGLRGIYSYSNPSLAMAAYIAERAAARPFPVVLDSILLRPLGMTRTTTLPMVAMTFDHSLGYVSNEGSAPQVVRPMPANAAHWGAGFIFMNAAETGRLAIAMMNDGMLDGRRVLSPDAIRAVTTAHVLRGGSRMLGVGYGMNTDSVGNHRVWQKGGNVEGFRGLLTMWPVQKLAIAVFTNQETDLTYHATAKAAEMIAGITGSRLPVDARSLMRREPTAAERAELIGAYHIGRRRFTIEESDGRLVRRTINLSPIMMTAKDRFVVLPANGEVTEFQVIRDASGGIHYLFTGNASFPRVR